MYRISSMTNRGWAYGRRNCSLRHWMNWRLIEIKSHNVPIYLQRNRATATIFLKPKLVKYLREDKRLDYCFHSSFPGVSSVTEITMQVVENQWKNSPHFVSTLLDGKAERKAARPVSNELIDEFQEPEHLSGNSAVPIRQPKWSCGGTEDSKETQNRSEKSMRVRLSRQAPLLRI